MLISFGSTLPKNYAYQILTLYRQQIERLRTDMRRIPKQYPADHVSQVKGEQKSEANFNNIQLITVHRGKDWRMLLLKLVKFQIVMTQVCSRNRPP